MRIDAACRRSSRDPAQVRIVAVTKSVPVGDIRLAIESGLDVLGENRVQEVEAKIAKLGEVGRVEWHFLGRLQSNKVGRAVSLFDVIESIDSVELATRVARVARETGRGPYSVYVQVNVDSDPAKGGFEPETLSRHLDEILELDGVDVRGLMTVGRQVDRPEDARLTFVRLRELSERLRRLDGRVGTELSMGMSDDFEVGVEEGATIVRLGRVIFGQRPTA